MAERNMPTASVIRLIEARNDIDNAIQGYEVARDALGPCARMLDQAEASLLLADVSLGEGVFDGVSGAYWFRDDPEPHVAAARSHLQRLQACLEHESTSEPADAGSDGTSSGDGGDADATLPPAQASSGSWRVVAGLALIGLAAYGLWKVR